ncbi:plasmid partitioning protein RepB [Pseudaminobacter sp. NGMCC 1.201702]|uniref:plasmid partitioning protein RepB n=1 Tax=Pseudaminobacter sp. NGMCC 1.201702 TaxID=3391825 RepID=UPI0039F0464E
MSSRRAGKSILASFGAFADPAPMTEDAISARSDTQQQHLPRVGAGVIGATQRSLNELRLEHNRLQALVDAGGILELDPELVDPSPFPDRLPDADDFQFLEFKKRFGEDGQKVPISVRRHPQVDGRYQVVYGHRRHRAARELGIKVRAVLADLTDAELVVVQGIENSARVDLSWIERALFAWRMDGAGIKAKDIRAALSIDDPELARMRNVMRTVPLEIIQIIGRAEKVGRPRWVALARAIDDDKQSVERITKTLSADKVLAQPSDQRFRLAFSAAQSPSQAGSAEAQLIKAPSGEAFGKMLYSGTAVQLKISKPHAAAFAHFLEGELPALVEKFFAQEGQE